MRLRERVFQLREEIGKVAQASGAERLRLFGSVARGEESSKSDVDFLVRLEAGRTLLDLARLENALEQLIGRRVDVVTEEGLSEPVRALVLRDAVDV